MIKSETGLCRVAGVGVSGASDFSGSESSGSFEAVEIPLGILDAREVWEEPLRDDEEMKVLCLRLGEFPVPAEEFFLKPRNVNTSLVVSLARDLRLLLPDDDRLTDAGESSAGTCDMETQWAVGGAERIY